MTSILRSIPRRRPKSLLRPLSARNALVQSETENASSSQLSATFSYQSQSSAGKRNRHGDRNNQYQQSPVDSKVFNIPIGKLHSGLIKASLKKIYWYINSDKTGTGPAQALELLIRLLEEQRVSDKTILNQGVIFNVLKNCQKHSHSGDISATNLLKALRMLEHIELLWDPKWPSFVLSSIAKIPGKDAPYQAERLLKQLEENVEGHQLNLVDYTVVLRSYAKSGLVDQAQKLLQHMEQRYEEGRTNDSPNTFSYSCVIDACAKSKGGANAVRCASNLIEHMENETNRSNIRPTAATYTGVLKTYANARMAQEAEDTLEHMKRLNQEGRLQDPPNLIHFSCVVEAWARSDDPNALHRAEALFDRLRTSEDPQMKPNLICYSNLLLAYKKRNLTSEAVTILKEMTERFISGELREPPSLFHYNTVLDTFSKSKNSDSPARAEFLLNLMFEMKDAGHSNIEPDSFTFLCVLACYDKAKMLDAAENLLHQMMDRHDAGHLKHPPKTIHYNVVLNMFAKSRDANATSRAENLIKTMSELHASGHESVKPDVISYTSLLKSYAQEGRSQDAELLLQKMHTMHGMGDLGQPNNITYSVVLTAHANSNEGCSAELAQITFNRMLELYSTGSMAHPDYVNYACVLSCFAKDGEGEDAKQLIQSMHRHHSAGEILKGPDTLLYNTALNALAKSEKKESLANAENLLEQMKKKYREGNKEVRPDLISYTTLLKSYANAGKAEEAESMLKEMFRLHGSGELLQPPNLISFNSVMNAITKSGLADAPKRAEALLQQIQERGLTPDSFTKSSFFSLFKRQGNMEDGKKIWRRIDPKA